MNKGTRGSEVWRQPAVILHAEVCQSLANPVRLAMIDLLSRQERTVSEMGRLLRLPKANLSQHLGALRRQGIVEVRRAGRFLHCRLTSPKIPKACALMREVLLEQLEKKSALAQGKGESS